jgi:parallel beta-helix repeat protein
MVFPINQNVKTNIPELDYINYPVHDKLEIIGDEELNTIAAEEQWPGSGSKSNPYIVEKFMFYANDFIIYYTTLYLLIRNCVFQSYGGSVLQLYNAHNLIISNNICSGTSIMTLNGCNNVNVTENLFINCTMAIYCGLSSNVAIEHNNIVNDGRLELGGGYEGDNENITIRSNIIQGGGINVGAVHQIIIENNLIYDSYKEGIRISNSQRVNITKNTVHNSQGDGIYIFDSDNCTIKKNLIRKNMRHGIYLDLIHFDFLSEITITYNALMNNSNYGIYFLDDVSPLDNPTGLAAYNNFIGNNLGGTSQASDYSLITNFRNNFWNEWTGPDDNDDGIVDQNYQINLNSSWEPQHDASPNIHPIEMYFLPHILYPYTGAILKGNKTIRWTNFTTIPDSPVNYSLFYSPDGGTHWQLLAANLTGNQLIWPTLNLNDASTYIVKINIHLSNGTTKETYSNGVFSISNHGIIENTTTTLTVVESLKNPLSFLFNPNIIFGVLLMGVISVILIRRRGKYNDNP